MKAPLITVIIPVYNAERFVSDCVESITNQDHRHLQIIAVNDGSTDASRTILSEMAEKDGRIEVIDQPNAGVSVARNTGLSAAKGDFVAFVDADDWLDADALSESLKTIQAENADVVMWSYTREYGGKSEPKRIFESDLVFEGEAVKSKIQRRMIGLVDEELRHPDRADGLSTVWGKLYRAELLTDIRFRDIREIGSFEDGVFNFCVFGRVKRAVFLDRNWYHYRKENVRSATAFRKETAKQWEVLLDVLKELLDEGSYGEEYYRAYQNRICTSMLSKAMILTRSDLSIKEQSGVLKQHLQTERSVQAFESFPLAEMPIYWKVFYFLCRKRLSTSVAMMAKCMDFLVKRIG